MSAVRMSFARKLQPFAMADLPWPHCTAMYRLSCAARIRLAGVVTVLYLCSIVASSFRCHRLRVRAVYRTHCMQAAHVAGEALNNGRATNNVSVQSHVATYSGPERTTAGPANHRTCFVSATHSVRAAACDLSVVRRLLQRRRSAVCSVREVRQCTSQPDGATWRPKDAVGRQGVAGVADSRARAES